MKKYQAFLFALSVLVCMTAVPAFAANKVKVPSHDAKALVDESVVKGILERGKASDADNVDVLAPLSGDWNYTASFFAVPGAEPQQATGTVTNKMTLDNRFLSSTFEGGVNIGGHALLAKGQGLIGYDNAKKSFTSVWIDTLTTGMMIGTGQYDKKENVLKETGKFTNPLTGQEESFRSELQFTDSQSYKRTIFTVDKAGKETKLMEIDYTKK